MAETSELSAEQREELQRLETRLKQLLREKYRQYWHAKATPGQEVPDVSRFQGEIREVFDAIRLIDKKYKIPPFHMYED